MCCVSWISRRVDEADDAHPARRQRLARSERRLDCRRGLTAGVSPNSGPPTCARDAVRTSCAAACPSARRGWHPGLVNASTNHRIRLTTLGSQVHRRWGLTATGDLSDTLTLRSLSRPDGADDRLFMITGAAGPGRAAGLSLMLLPRAAGVPAPFWSSVAGDQHRAGRVLQHLLGDGTGPFPVGVAVGSRAEHDHDRVVWGLEQHCRSVAVHRAQFDRYVGELGRPWPDLSRQVGRRSLPDPRRVRAAAVAATQVLLGPDGGWGHLPRFGLDQWPLQGVRRGTGAVDAHDDGLAARRRGRSTARRDGQPARGSARGR